MTNQHPITPPPELRQLWAQQAQRMNPRDPIAWQEHIANQAAQWGANQELEACCEWLECNYNYPQVNHPLRAARRPEPPSLRKQAYDALDTYIYGEPDPKDKERTYNTIRRALEALDD
jgi:hypothetical protein